MWNFSICCGRGNIVGISELDHSGSIVFSLAEPLLDEGTLLVADNFVQQYTIGYAFAATQHKYCCTMRNKRSKLPPRSNCHQGVKNQRSKLSDKIYKAEKREAKAAISALVQGYSTNFNEGPVGEV